MAASAAVAVAVVGGAMAHEKERKAAGKEKKGRKIQRGTEAAQEAAALRKQVRQERIRRAQILASAETSGVAGASSEAGSISALKTITASNIAFTKSQGLAADAASRQFQSAANLKATAGRIQVGTDIASAGLSAFAAKPTKTQPGAPVEEGAPLPGLNQ